ncbi:hypothetical protein MC885_007228 [Smutsia gigantea]|nr:hypothetical protein MC885_007228 [Smutsia gigantea]
MASPGFPAAGPGLGSRPKGGGVRGPSPAAAASFASFSFGVLFKNAALRTRFVPLIELVSPQAFESSQEMQGGVCSLGRQ